MYRGAESIHASHPGDKRTVFMMLQVELRILLSLELKSEPRQHQIEF